MQPARNSENKWESITFQFNKALGTIEPPLFTVIHDTIFALPKEFFPRFGVSPVQSDNCDTFAELKKQIYGTRWEIQHLIDDVNSVVVYISAKDKLIESYNANVLEQR